MTRYEVGHDASFDPAMKECPSGEYVLFDEAEESLAALRAENTRLREALEGLLKVKRVCREPDIHWESARHVMRSAEAKAEAALAGRKGE